MRSGFSEFQWISVVAVDDVRIHVFDRQRRDRAERFKFVERSWVVDVVVCRCGYRRMHAKDLCGGMR